MSPIKPTRDDATSATDPRQVYDDKGPAPLGKDAHPRLAASGRKPVGSAAESAEHPPHVTENDRNADLQDGEGEDIAALPANASGVEEKPAVTGGIRHESAYNDRPEEDKDQPPSERAR